MQRLSLDSSSSKLHSYGGRKEDTYDIVDLKGKESASFSPPSLSSPAAYEDHEFKDFKPGRLSFFFLVNGGRLSLHSPYATTHQKHKKLVHFIPVLTLICFIILYLSSHNPSQSDMAQFNGFMRPTKHLESDDISGSIGADALAIRNSIRNLQETESFAGKSLPRRRTSHRKTADF